MTVDYAKVAKAITHYQAAGFQVLDVPWWVPESIVRLTMPAEAKPYRLSNNEKCLIGSGEQGFLYLAAKGQLPKGKWQTTTPCFRYEQQGPLSRKGFVKTELIVTDESMSLDEIVACCLKQFSAIVPKPMLLEVVTTPEGFDIEYAGVEVGSYGTRQTSFLKWTYATGIAEPRLSGAISTADYTRHDVE